MSVRSFFAELRRRHVVRISITYVVVAFMILEGADVLLPALRVPEWTMTVLVVLVVAGFPLAVVLAWAFERTPEGLRRDEPLGLDGRLRGSVAAPEENNAPAAVVEEERPEPAEAESISTDSRTSLAVLPFDNLSGEADSDYFSDGVTEQLNRRIA